MPSLWNVRLEGVHDPEIPVEAPHAVVSRWLDVDHNASPKAYALSPPRFDRGCTILTVRLLDDALAGPLAAHVVPGEAVRLGRHWFTVAEPPQLLAGTAWKSLGTGQRQAWELEFLSPTAFRRGNRTSPWPAPQSVITSLLERWRGIDPATASTRDVRDLAGQLWVSDLDGHSQVIQLRSTTVSGFLGRVRYVCDGADADAAVIDALLAFAAFAGVGSHTAFGLGTVRVQASWRAGTLDTFATASGRDSAAESVDPG